VFNWKISEKRQQLSKNVNIVWYQVINVYGAYHAVDESIRFHREAVLCTVVEKSYIHVIYIVLYPLMIVIAREAI